ncbi:hypothetical protein K466DRAFT_30548 [Polyporus arcularius HHB13444]|uniref:Uncharacterized protein n=1 Tax=Polyporus arcularius HHB13444 TaxID=1314778 RepID=A0A5C3PHV4_9APHY|nr:hypothetical protein K466DRAFT_30548 [Polyporus arcularius HHB13444]
MGRWSRDKETGSFSGSRRARLIGRVPSRVRTARALRTCSYETCARGPQLFVCLRSPPVDEEWTQVPRRSHLVSIVPVYFYARD